MTDNQSYSTDADPKRIPLFLGLGSNVGSKRENIYEALRLLDEYLGVHFSALADLIETEPWGFESDENFINTVVRYDLQEPVDIEKAAKEILSICKKVERKMGREEHALWDDLGNRMYASRIIDVDILLFGSAKVDLVDLKIPHPLMRERDFVMIPLRQLEAEYL